MTFNRFPENCKNNGTTHGKNMDSSGVNLVSNEDKSNRIGIYYVREDAF